MATKKNKEFQVEAVIKAWVTVTIHAFDLADAVEQSKKFGIVDFAAIEGECFDSGCEIAGVRESALIDEVF